MNKSISLSTSRTWISGLFLSLVLLLALGAASAKSSPKAPAQFKHNGLCWVGSKPVTLSHLQQAKKLGVNWISQTPFGWQPTHDTTKVTMSTGNRVWWGERDEGLKITTRLGQKVGIKVMIKPHIWMHDPETGHWRGTISMNSEKEWQVWFDSYSKFMLHYARLAQAEKADALCIGTELRMTMLAHPEKWRQLIQEIRKVYKGELTYAANWDREVFEVPFWKDLDYIGVQAYFPLASQDHPTRAQMVKGWRPHVARLKALAEKTGKPILFTEAGYRSAPGTATRPWEWPRQGEGKATPKDLKLQADAWQALFDSFWDEPWFLGVDVWKWHPHRASDASASPLDRRFSPQGKPALDVIKTRFLTP